jgi:hypothetical protein
MMMMVVVVVVVDAQTRSRAEQPPLSELQRLARTPADVARIQRYAYARGREDFWTFRKIINPTLIMGWWQRHLAHHIQLFFEDLRSASAPRW